MALKDRVLAKFPAIVSADTGVGVSIVSGVYNFFLNLYSLTELPVVPDATAAKVLTYLPDPTNPSTVNGVYNTISIANLIASGSAKIQMVTTGNAAIRPDSNIVIVNQASPMACTLTLPLSATKSGQVLIVDWKGDAATNNITVVPSGVETFQAGITSWAIAGNGASTSFRPVSGMGYVI